MLQPIDLPNLTLSLTVYHHIVYSTLDWIWIHDSQGTSQNDQSQGTS